jgi:hypothetical protein
MATFHAKGKIKLTFPVDDFGMSRVTKKCVLCLMSSHELFMLSWTKHMMVTTMLLNPIIKF